MVLVTKRLEAGRFVWPSPAEGVVRLTPAQLGYAARSGMVISLVLKGTWHQIDLLDHARP